MRASEPVWREQSRAPRYPQISHDLKVDVAVVGGGITGVTAALLLARAGKSVALLEGRTIASGVTERSTAHLTEAVDTRYVELERYGKETARLVRESSRAAIELIAELSNLCEGNAGFKRVPGYLFSEDASETDALKAEAEAARRAGATVEICAVPLPFANAPGVRFDNQAQIDPCAYVTALASRIEGPNVSVFEESMVVDVKPGEPSRVLLEHGPSILADDVILATHAPPTKTTFQTKIAQYRSYVVAAPTTQPLDALFWDTQDPYHYIRSALIGGTPHLIIGGEDHKTGQDPDGGYGAPFERLEAYARRLGVEVTSRWSAQVVEPVDGLPYIGQPSRSERIYVATGYSGNGTTFGTIAAMILSDQLLGRSNAYAELYRATRFKPLASIPPLVEENVDFPLHLLRDRLHGSSKVSPTRIENGQAAVLEVDGERVACYRDDQGRLHAVSAICTHFGCQVAFNPSERTWDCPCHGSRFGVDGAVLDGPATKRLAKRLL
jgi:glycine/D-amino acid oxidase-like deaminating enzyme/nitrite reductase/ring-hydroxylating ferredoxin subunit